MLQAVRNIVESAAKPDARQVFFPSLPFNRKLILWYADKLVKKGSCIEPPERLHEIDGLRKRGRALTFICNHLTYADSHIIESLLIRSGFKDLADHLVHIAGQKTFQFARRPLTRSLNTIRVYQPKASVEGIFKKKMNSRALQWAARMKRKGYSLLVYPEGTRTRRLRRFNLYSANPKTTIYFRNSLVIPLALMGSEDIMPVGSILPKPSAVRLMIGEPVHHTELEEVMRKEASSLTEREFRQRMMSRYMEGINNLLDPDYRHLSS